MFGEAWSYLILLPPSEDISYCRPPGLFQVWVCMTSKMKLQVWIKVQPEQIAWSNVLTGTPWVVCQPSTVGMGEVEEAMPLPSPEDALGPTTVTSKLMGE